MSDEHEDDDLPPERVNLFSTIDNKEGANLIRDIYFFVGGYCALIIIGVVALFYFTGRVNGIMAAIVLAIWVFNRLDQYKLGRRSDIKLEIISFASLPLLLILILFISSSRLDLVFMSTPFLILSFWGFSILGKIKNNDNLVRELKSRADLYQQYRQWLYAEKEPRKVASKAEQMAIFQVEPFQITEEFQDCWFAAAQHLNLRVKDTGASWLRAHLPCFREHLSFALGNQLFFIQLYDVNQPENGWLALNRLEMAVEDAKGIACLMPMDNKSGPWHPVFGGWGLTDLTGETALNPVDLITDEPIEMTDWEIHDAGIQVVRDHLKQNGWEINSWQSDLEVDPSIVAQKDGKLHAFVVRNSNKGKEVGKRPENYKNITLQMADRGVSTKFVGLKVSAADDRFDKRLEHLKRHIFRRSQLLFSEINIEELDTSVN